MSAFSLLVGAGSVSLMAGAGLLYLGNPNQGLLDKSLGRRGVVGGSVLLVVSLAVFLSILGAAAALAVWSVSLMLALTALPFSTLLRRRRE